jgi:diacylglycerol kinase family enzyme
MPTAIPIILNVAAGTVEAQSHIEAELRDLFRVAGADAEIISLRPGQNDAAEAAREATAHSPIVVAAGGDGTVSSVAAGIVRSNAALGVLPLGTLNHFAKDLHIPLRLRDAVAVVAAGHIERVDVGKLNERVFVNNSSIGVYPGIVEEREELRRQGNRRWKAMAIATLRVLRRYRGVAVNMAVDEHGHTWRTPFVFVGNNEYAIDGLRIGARARLDQGKLFVYLAPRAHTRDLPGLLAKALLGRVAESGALEIVPATELRIDTRKAARIRVAIDGEVAIMSTPLQYRACPGALRVVVPRR